LKQVDYNTRLARLHLWTLEARRNRAVLIELFKIYKNLSAITLGSLFEQGNDNRTRGHSLKLQKHYCHLDLQKFFFSERVITRGVHSMGGNFRGEGNFYFLIRQLIF